jgi:iron complex transport system permease protein
MRTAAAGRILVVGPTLTRTGLVLGSGVLLLVVVGLVAIALGSVAVAPGDTIRIIAHHLGLPVTVDWSVATDTIVWQIRLPRVLAGAVVGAGLGLAGVVFQALLRNPMADPYVIGSASGASLGAVLAITAPVVLPGLALGAGSAWLGIGAVQLMAFIGGLVAVSVVLLVAGRSPRNGVLVLLLTGYAVSSLLAAVVALLIVSSGRALGAVVGWLMGSLAGASFGDLALAAPLVLGASLLLVLRWRSLNVLLLGDEAAAHLGIQVRTERRILIALATLSTSAAVAIAGTIGFVGLVIPHLVRLVLGPDHRLLLPASALAGASLLVLADLGARLSGGIPVGVVTALLGAPFFIWLLHRAGSEERPA